MAVCKFGKTDPACLAKLDSIPSRRSGSRSGCFHLPVGSHTAGGLGQMISKGQQVLRRGNKTFRAQQLRLEARGHTGLESQVQEEPAAYKEEGKDNQGHRETKITFAFSSFAPSQLGNHSWFC